MPPKKKLRVDGDPAPRGEKILSKEEEEEMSSALIAQLLAQEGGDQHGYYAEYNNDANYDILGSGAYSDDDDDYRNDYNYRPKSRSRKGKRKPRQAAKPSARATPNTATPDTALPTTATEPEPPAKAPMTDSTAAETGIEVPAISTEKAKKVEKAHRTEKTEKITEKATEKTTDKAAEKATEKATEMAPEKSTDPLPVPREDASCGSEIAAGEPLAAQPQEPPKKVEPPKRIPQVYNTGVYSEREETAFVEALDIFGRDWRRVEEHVGTRDPNSIRSHAQKHFIKLFRDNIPLPPKVLATGPGYTLSGNDLDPYSSAARPYLSQRHFDDPSLLPAQGGTVFTGLPGKSRAEKGSVAKKAKTKAEGSASKVKEAVEEMKDLTIRKTPRANREVTREREVVREREIRNAVANEPSYSGRTDYSKARLRNSKERASISFRQMASDLDPLTMVKCEPFCGQPKSGMTGCQPFGITVQSNVLLGMDFHAHLMTTEIIGFLAGNWDGESRTIHISAIFPCRSLQTGQNHVNVEMDPTSEFEVRQEIEKRKMKIVGWYHSHPTFTPDPSLVDIENQTSYQNLFKDESMNEEPFVGAIVGPYDERLPGLSSVINWFYVSQSPQERGHPKRLVYDLIEDNELSEEESSHWMRLFDEYRDSPERTNFQEQWRQEESETKLQKMLVSLGRRMPWLRNNLLKSKESQEPETPKVPEKSPEHPSASMEVEQTSPSSSIHINVDDTPSESTLPETPVVESSSMDLSETGAITADADADAASTPAPAPAPAPTPVPVTIPVPVSAPASTPAPETTTETAPEVNLISTDVPPTTVSESEHQDIEAPVPEANPSMAEATPMEGVEPTSVSEAANGSEEDKAPQSPSVSETPLARSYSSESDTSCAKGIAGFGGLINDPFLLRVEQELSAWTPYVG